MAYDRITQRVYAAEAALEDIDALRDSYYTLDNAKAQVARIIRQPWFKTTINYSMRQLGFKLDLNKTQIRKGKARPRNGRAASTRFHMMWNEEDSYASIVLNSFGGSVCDVGRRTVVHEAAHFAVGPYEGHGSKWRATYVALLEKCDMVAEARGVETAFNHFGVPIDLEWLADMRAMMEVGE